MRSRFVDKFQHDSQAGTYDLHVQDESDPIRTGYNAALEWVASESNKIRPGRILELGSGTGSLTAQIKNYDSIICVDASSEMVKHARQKLGNNPKISFKICDFLEFLESNNSEFDAILSTYALHHLTESEKRMLFDGLIPLLQPGGVFVIGDLMFFDEKQKAELIEYFTQKRQLDVVEDIYDEFFWNISAAKRHLEKQNILLREHRFSLLSWGFVARSARSTIDTRNRPRNG